MGLDTNGIFKEYLPINQCFQTLFPTQEGKKEKIIGNEVLDSFKFFKV